MPAGAGAKPKRWIEMEDGTALCGRCGSAAEWVVCSDCEDGETSPGELHEMDPLWYDPDDTEPCETCLGKGGWYACLAGDDDCQSHPWPPESRVQPPPR